MAFCRIGTKKQKIGDGALIDNSAEQSDSEIGR